MKERIMVKPFNYEDYAPKRYTVETVFSRKDGAEKRLVVYNGGDLERAHSMTEFWDEKQDTYFTDNFLEMQNETPLEVAYRKLDALAAHIRRS